MAGIASASVVAEGVSQGRAPTPVGILSRLPRPLAKLADFGPLEFGQGLQTPRSSEVGQPRTISVSEPPAGKPRKQMVTAAEPRIPTVTPWTVADITPEPAAPASESSGPAKLVGKAKGFVSRSQWRKFWADPKLRPFADKKAHASKGGPITRYRVLPEKKGV